MKVLLINPPERPKEDVKGISFGARSFIKRLRVLPPLGLGYLAAVLKGRGVEVDILDANALGQGLEDIRAHLEKTRPSVVGITAVTPLHNVVTRICDAAKEVDRNTTVVVGGPQATLMPELTICHKSIDVVLVGEAEYGMLELAKAAESGRDLAHIPGLLYKSDGTICHTAPCEEKPDLDALPFPARELLPNHLYYDATTHSRYVTSLVTARGCPYRCSLCEKHIRGGHYRARSPENVIEEIAEIVERYGHKEIVIYDDTFTAQQNRAARICELMLERGLEVKWDCRTRVDCVSTSLLKLMKRAGCSRISYGVEASDQRVLDALNKRTSPQQAKDAFRWTREAGIDILAFYMLGSPYETKESIERTIKLAKELDADFSYFSITIPYPGTDLYELAQREGYLTSDYWKEFVLNNGEIDEPIPVFEKGDITRDYLNGVLKRAYRRFYLRPGYVLSRLKKIRSLEDFLWHVRMARLTAIS